MLVAHRLCGATSFFDRDDSEAWLVNIGLCRLERAEAEDEDTADSDQTDDAGPSKFAQTFSEPLCVEAAEAYLRSEYPAEVSRLLCDDAFGHLEAFAAQFCKCNEHWQEYSLARLPDVFTQVYKRDCF